MTPPETPPTTMDPEREIQALRARVAELESWNRSAERAAEALQKSGDSFRRIFDHSNDAIFIIAPDEDRVVDVNQRATRMLGFTTEELLATPVSSIHPGGLPQLRAFARRVATDGAGMRAELECITRGGGRVPVEVSASMLDLGDRRYMIALVRHISDRRRAEQELRRAHRRLEADLEAAVQLQRALLPCESPRVEGLRTAWHVRPSERLAGDTLNLFRLDDRHVGFYLLDVSGHGVKAAMLSFTLHRMLSPFPSPLSALHEPAPGGYRVVPPRQVIERLNATFQMDDGTRQYFTIFYGVLDHVERRLRFVSAGQGAPVLVSAAGEVSEIERYDLPVGVLPGVKYEEHEITLERGATLYIYSDGMVETFGESGDPFGKERLLQAIGENRGRRLGEALLDLVERVNRFGCPECIRDDMSVLAVELSA